VLTHRRTSRVVRFPVGFSNRHSDDFGVSFSNTYHGTVLALAVPVFVPVPVSVPDPLAVPVLISVVLVVVLVEAILVVYSAKDTRFRWW